MRYRVTTDLVLEGTLLAWGDGLYLQQQGGDKKDQWEVYSLFTRKLIGIMNTTEVGLYLQEDDKAPKTRLKEKPGGKSFKDIPLALLLFLLPIWGISQEPVQWYSKMVQTGDDMFELHLSAKIDSNWFLYPLNERKRCELCPVLRLEHNPLWIAIGGPDIYYSVNKVPPDRCGSIPNPYCPVIRYIDSIDYVQVIKSKVAANCTVRGYIEYIPTHRDSIGQPKTLMFARSLYSSSQQPITRLIIP